MKEIGRYCKAYMIEDCRRYPNWHEHPSSQNPGGPEDKAANEDDVVYLHENLNVTRGIYLNENIVFDEVTPEWIDFCKDTLKFKPPNGEDVEKTDTDQS